MALVTWKNSRNAEVKTKEGKVFKIKIKKSAGGISYNLLDSSEKVLKSGSDIEALQIFAREFYRYV